MLKDRYLRREFGVIALGFLNSISCTGQRAESLRPTQLPAPLEPKNIAKGIEQAKPNKWTEMQMVVSHRNYKIYFQDSRIAIEPNADVLKAMAARLKHPPELEIIFDFVPASSSELAANNGQLISSLEAQAQPYFDSSKMGLLGAKTAFVAVSVDEILLLAANTMKKDGNFNQESLQKYASQALSLIFYQAYKNTIIGGAKRPALTDEERKFAVNNIPLLVIGIVFSEYPPLINIPQS